jgi:type I restriction enzyme M protein
VNGLKGALVKAKQQLLDLDSDIEALEQKNEQEIEAIEAGWKGTKAELKAQVKAAKEGHKQAAKELKESKKTQQKGFKDEIKRLEKVIPDAEYELKLLSNRGKLELILADPDLVVSLKEHWISTEVAKRLDYPVFMAVSERGGKDNSGDYKHVLDGGGSLVEFPDGHPQEGQLVVDQDLVNYDYKPEDLADASMLAEEKLCVAEAFVRFAQEHEFNFWEEA